MSKRYLYHNKQFLSEKASLFSGLGRSQRLGDGIFETILVVGGRLYNAAAHMRRLRAGLTFYRFSDCDDDIIPLCKELIVRNHLYNGYIRIVITRAAQGNLGYYPENLDGIVTIQTIEQDLPRPQSITLWQSSIILANPSPCKTSSALPYITAIIEARDHGCDNALLRDPSGHLCETANGNVFWITGETLCTPSVDLPMIQGTIRDVVLTLWAGPKKEGHYTLSDIKNADAAFMTNIGGLISPIVGIKPEEQSFPVDARVLALRELLIEHIQAFV